MKKVKKIVKKKVVHKQEPKSQKKEVISKGNFSSSKKKVRAALMGDLNLPLGTSGNLIPSATKDGAPVDFPPGTVFSWTISDEGAVSIDDPNAQNPLITGIAATDPNNPVTITLMAVEDGFSHSDSHSCDVTSQGPSDNIDNVDFTLVPVPTAPPAMRRAGQFGAPVARRVAPGQLSAAQQQLARAAQQKRR